MKNMKQVFITGSTGLIGSHLVVELLKKGECEVHCHYRSEQSLKKLEAVCKYFKVDYSQLKFHNQELSDIEGLEALFCEIGVDVVYHTAAIVEIDGSQEAEMLRCNLELTTWVCSALESMAKRGVKPMLVHVTSIAALGERPYPELITEKVHIENLAKCSAYSQSKFLSENRVHRAVEMGVNAVLVAPSVVIGVTGDGSKMDGMQQIYKTLSKGMPIYTNGVMGFVDVRDVVRGMMLLSEREDLVGEKYILSGVNLDFRDFITAFNVAFGRRKPWLYMSKPLLQMVGGVAKFFSKVFGGKPLITPDTVAYLTARSAYDGSKICREFSDFEYEDFSESARMVVDRMKK